MTDILTFPDRNSFRNWLIENGENSGGVWLLFGKKGGPATLSANDALEEALCFGWIGGQMQSLDEKSYKKYFAPRRANSKWSQKNKALVADLEKRGIMTDFGRAKIEEAKANGQWDKPKAPPENEDQITFLSDILKSYEPAFTNFAAMSPSVKRTYTRAFLDAKTDAGREKRLAWIVDRLNKNLKPM
jgi:uncharacterized protein YdeI (YjbR/CyaY-like superfamily)